jgi:hypothetical protein
VIGALFSVNLVGMLLPAFRAEMALLDNNMAIMGLDVGRAAVTPINLFPLNDMRLRRVGPPAPRLRPWLVSAARGFRGAARAHARCAAP